MSNGNTLGHYLPRNFDILWRHTETYHAISALRLYLRGMEENSPKILNSELDEIDAQCPHHPTEDDILLMHSEKGDMARMFEEDIVPTMRYSFIVFIHTVFETRLRAFCLAQRSRLSIGIGLSDLQGDPVKQAKLFLTKLAGLAVGDFPEWGRLREFQEVRDCIVHAYGHVDENRHRSLIAFAEKAEGVEISTDGRLVVSRGFAERHLSIIEAFFERLFLIEDALIKSKVSRKPTPGSPSQT